MNFNDFRVQGKEAVDFVCDLNDGVDFRRVIPNVSPGYLMSILPQEAPKKPEMLNSVLDDIEKKILPGIIQWQHSGFHAYFPTGRGHPSLIGNMISDGIGCIGLSRALSPAFAELETIVLDWLGKALSIPSHFLYSSPNSTGGGMIQCSSSDCVLVSMLAARSAAIKYLKQQGRENEEADDHKFLAKLVAYTSTEAISAVEKAAQIAMVKLVILEVDDQCSLRGPTLADALQRDQDNGLHPFFVSCTLGTLANCAFDNLKEIGPIIKKLPQCWLHVDGSYAGSGFICPELRYLKEGLEFANSFSINCDMWLTVCDECSCLWIKDRNMLVKTFITDPAHLKQYESDQSIDFRQWGMNCPKRFKAMRLWITLRMYGIESLQNYIRNHCKLAKEFEKYVLEDDKFQMCNDVRVGIVCFRLKGSDQVNQDLLASINKEGKIHMMPVLVQGSYTLKFCMAHPNAVQQHIDVSWDIIRRHANEILERERAGRSEPLDLEERKRYSFIDFVPQEFNKCTNGLTDGARPFITVDTEKENGHRVAKKPSEDYPGNFLCIK